VLEKMGIYLESDPKKVAHSIDEFGIGFLFAPAFHPALKVLGSLRKNLGVSTVFNILGPLLNPVNVKRQLVGVYNYKLLNKMAEVLRALGSEEAFVVWGEDGLDELSLSAPTQIAHLKAGKIVSSVVRPEECGFRSVSPQVLKGGTAADNAGMIESIFKGERGPKRDWVLLNSAAGLMVGGKVANFKEGVELAEETIDSGRVLQILQKMRTL
jgi:anthranilate phosphoribosyltransferase